MTPTNIINTALFSAMASGDITSEQASIASLYLDALTAVAVSR